MRLPLQGPRHLVPAVLLAVLYTIPGALAATLEYRVKAAFLINFTKFIEWPAAAFATPTTPFSLCVAGEDPFGDDLDRIAMDHRVQGHPVLVRRLDGGPPVPLCHLLFVTSSVRRDLPDLLAAVADQPTLTVGETDEFTDRGGVLRFFLDEGRVRFGIEREAMARAGLTVSSKLMRLASRYRPRAESWP